jgi:cysteine synthase
MVCAVLGHPFTAFISEGNCNERMTMMKFFGANVITVAQNTKIYGSVSGQDFDRVKNEANDFAIKNNAYFVNQFRKRNY